MLRFTGKVTLLKKATETEWWSIWSTVMDSSKQLPTNTPAFYDLGRAYEPHWVCPTCGASSLVDVNTGYDTWKKLTATVHSSSPELYILAPCESKPRIEYRLS